jgi:hypothetical protein
MKLKTFLTFAVLALVSTAYTLPPSTAKARIVAPSNDVNIPPVVKGKLVHLEEVRAYVPLPNGDAVVVYDTVRDKDDTADFMDNEPQLAFVRNDDVVSQLNVSDAASSGPLRFDGMVVAPATDGAVTTVFAFKVGVDSSGTLFLFVGQNGNRYEIVTSLEGAQAQLRFSNDLSGSFTLWAADGQVNKQWDKQCVWCPKYYTVTKYEFQGRNLRRLETLRSKRGYDPNSFFDVPFKVGDTTEPQKGK